MDQYGELFATNGRYALRFERNLPLKQDEVFDIIIDPNAFKQWYPFATGEMELKVEGGIAFNDGEGSTYEGVISEFERPHTFAFREINDLIEIFLEEKGGGCQLIFTHTFDDKEMAKNMAAGWHRCLDALRQIIEGNSVVWKENSAELRDVYGNKFQMNKTNE